MLEPIIFEDESLEGSSSTPTNAAWDLGFGIEQKDGAESNASGSDGDYDMEDPDYWYSCDYWVMTNTIDELWYSYLFCISSILHFSMAFPSVSM